MKSIDKLRTAARNMAKGRNLENHEECNLLLVIADEIEAEIGRDYMKLPVDEGGVPWTIADKKFADILGETHTITGILYSSLVGTWYLRDAHDVTHNARQCRHVKPRTIESVLRDMLDAYDSGEHGETPYSLIADYADEIRELMGGDA